MPNLSAETARTLYLGACETELRTFKPGNVSVHSEGHDMTVTDFRVSAAVSASPLCDASLGLGERIYRAIEATRRAVGCNTNLGIVLLAAPLIRAYESCEPDESFSQAVRRVLQDTTVDDAGWVYQAILLAQPGGLGSAPDQDVNVAPTASLLSVMKLAQDRDSVARQYARSFEDIFHFAIPLYHSHRSLWDNEEWAVLAVYAGLLVEFPDSHVERKFGRLYNGWIADRMRLVGAMLSRPGKPHEVMRLLREVDREFKSRGINPGTTADLVVACLMAMGLSKARDGACSG